MKKNIFLISCCFISIIAFHSVLTQDKNLTIALKNIINPVNITISYLYSNYPDEEFRFYNDTVINILVNLSREVEKKPLHMIKISDNNLLQVSYNCSDIKQSGLNVSIDFDSIYTAKQKIDELNNEVFAERQRFFLSEIENINTEINQKIINKSFNRIGDILYDLDYYREPMEGSVIGYRYTRYFYYDENKYSNYILHTVRVWYSYGYGNLYYSITGTAYFNVNGKVYIEKLEI